MRKSGGRTYLQQLAQPVLPGATVLTARPIFPTYANEMAPQVPVIEERFNFPDSDLTPPSRNFARPLVDRTRSAIETSINPAEAPANGYESPRTAARHSDLPRTSAEPGTVIQSVQHLEPRPASVANPQAHSVHEERSVEQPMRAETHKFIANSKGPEAPRIAQSPPNDAPPAEKQTAQRNTPMSAHESLKEPIASSKSAKDTPSSQFAPQDDSTKRKEIQQASDIVAPLLAQTAAKEKTEKPEVRTSEGPRVHIGTVEIRAVLPQPAIPQPAVMTQNVAQNNAVAQARGRSGAAEPLARGLDWSYGLVQG